MHLPIQIDEHSCQHLFKQIVNHISAQVFSGELAPGTKLPSTRKLSKHLAVSRWTCDRAYEELERRGVIENRPCVGTFVSERLMCFEPPIDNKTARAQAPSQAVPKLSEFGKRVAAGDLPQSASPKARGFMEPAPPLLPLQKWRHLTSLTNRSHPPAQSDDDAFGDPHLRLVLSQYLSRARGIDCLPEQLVLFAGIEPAIDLLARLFIDVGGTAVVEDTCSAGIRRIMSAQGIKIATAPVDAQGMNVESLDSLENVRMICVTPANQHPTSVALSDYRRLELLRFVQAKRCLLLEDDQKGWFNHGRNVPSLRAFAPSASIVHMSSFKQVLAPLAHLAFLVLPLQLVPIFRQSISLIETNCNSLELAVLAEFIAEGHFEHHLRQLRSTLLARRIALVSSIVKHLPGKAIVATAGGGSHLALRIDGQSIDHSDIEQKALECGLPMVSTRRCYGEAHPPGEFLVNFGSLEEEKIDPVISAFAAGLATSIRPQEKTVDSAAPVLPAAAAAHAVV